MKKLTVISILLMTVLVLNAQTTKIDSLENLLQNIAIEDTVRVNLLNKLALETIASDKEKALKYAFEAEKNAIKLDYKKGEAESLFSIGKCYYKLSDFVQALKYLNRSLELSIAYSDRNMIPECQNMIGNMHNKQGLYSVALNDYQEALLIFEELGNVKGVSSCYNNLGNVSVELRNYTKALFYYNKALKIREDMGDSLAVSAISNNIGTAYEQTQNIGQAIGYFKKSLSISKRINYYDGEINSNRNIAIIYKNLDSLQVALTYCTKAFELAKKINNKYETQYSNRILGTIYIKLGDYQKALDCSYSALVIANELELLDAKKEIYKQLSEISFATKEYPKAYNYHLLYTELKDSILNEESIKKATTLELQFQFEKEMQEMELVQQKKDAIVTKEVKYQKAIRNVFIGGLLAAIFLIFIVIRVARIKKKTNTLLRTKNEEISSKSEIINSKNTELKITVKHLKETQSQLLQAEKMASLGVLTAGVSHEINNPLNYIMGGYIGISKVLGKTTNSQDKDITILLSSIKTGIERISDVVKGLNQFSRNNETYNEDCDIHSIINNCLLILQYQLKGRIKVDKIFSVESILISGNVGKLHQVFVNLFTNSIQSIDNNGTISIATRKKEESVVIEISDTGHGISEEFLSRISEPFFTTKDPGEGTGLGLSITYTIVKEHNGNIIFESTKNKGTTVKIIFPLKSYKS